MGEAGLCWDGSRHHPFACEGGRADFAPRNAVEIEQLRYLIARQDHVSYEQVISGPGLHNIYRFLLETGRGTELPDVAEALRHQDPPAVITQAALAGRCDLCRQALDMLVSLCGAEAGNLALKIMASGGIYISGCIAPRIIELLKSPAFLSAFTDGRMTGLLRAMLVKVILNPYTPVAGRRFVCCVA